MHGVGPMTYYRTRTCRLATRTPNRSSTIYSNRRPKRGPRKIFYLYAMCASCFQRNFYNGRILHCRAFSRNSFSFTPCMCPVPGEPLRMHSSYITKHLAKTKYKERLFQLYAMYASHPQRTFSTGLIYIIKYLTGQRLCLCDTWCCRSCHK